MYNKCIRIIRFLKEEEEKLAKETSKNIRGIFKYYNIMNSDNIKFNSEKFADYIIELTDEEYNSFLNFYSEEIGVPKDQINVIFYNHKLYTSKETQNVISFFDKAKQNIDKFDKSLAFKIRENIENNNLIKQAEEKGLDLCNSLIEFTKEEYEDLLEEKEIHKQKIKAYERILKCLSKKTELLETDFSILLAAISEFDDKDISELAMKEIEEYETGIKRKQEELLKAKEIKKSIAPKVEYVDETLEIEYSNYEDELEDICVNKIYNNCLYVVECMTTPSQIKMHLNDLSYFCDIDSLCEFLLENLKEDSLAYITIKNYIMELNKEHVIKSTNEEEPIKILYIDTITNIKNIQNDLKDIPQENIRDVKKALEVFNLKDFNSKAQSITSIRKLKKVRCNDIRVVYKRMDKNLYVIVGIYLKKAKKGNDKIKKIKTRNDELNKRKYGVILENQTFLEEVLKRNEEVNESVQEILKGTNIIV